MNDDTRDNDKNWHVSLNNKYTPDASVFSSASPSPTSGAATIVTDAHIPPLGQIQHTKIFSPVITKKMTNKDTIDTNTEPEATTNATINSSYRSPSLTVSNSP